MSEQTTQPILIFVRDLMFSSRIVEAAKAANVPYRMIRKAESLTAEQGRNLIVDLDQDGAIEAAGAWRERTAGKAIGFISHVNTDGIARAKEAGVEPIYSRGQFTQLLPQIVRNFG
jgi:hypothetical protein